MNGELLWASSGDGGFVTLDGKHVVQAGRFDQGLRSRPMDPATGGWTVLANSSISGPVYRIRHAVADRRFAYYFGLEPSDSEEERYRTLRVWDVPSGRLLIDRSLPVDDDTAFALDRSGRLLALAYGSQLSIITLDTETTRVLQVAPTRLDVVTVLFSPNGRVVARVQEDIERTGRALQQMGPPQPSVTEVWDVNTATLRFRVDGEARAFSADGRLVLLGRRGRNREAATSVLDTTSAAAIATYEGSPRALAPDGSIAAVRDGKGLILHDLKSPRPAHRLPGNGAAFSPDSKRLAVTFDPYEKEASGVWIWNVDPLLGRPAPPAQPTRSVRPNMPTAPALLTAEQRWERWQTKFGLTIDDTDQIVSLWRPRADGQAGPRPIGGINAR